MGCDKQWQTTDVIVSYEGSLLNEIAQLREGLGIQPLLDEPTIKEPVVAGILFRNELIAHGVSGAIGENLGLSVSDVGRASHELGFNAAIMSEQMASHAEGRAIFEAVTKVGRENLAGGAMTLVTDKDPCGWCRVPLRKIACEHLKLDVLEVIGPVHRGLYGLAVPGGEKLLSGINRQFENPDKWDTLLV